MRTLVVLVGPTGVGKTDLCLELAKRIQCPILSADSRQIYSKLNIGVASPTKDQLALVKHYFIGNKQISDYYSASDFENDSISLLKDLFTTHSILIATGGSMMYIDALRYGIDEMPDVDQSIRNTLQEKYQKEGIYPILDELQKLDPEHYKIVDKKNPKRVIHALEVCLTTGTTYTSFRKKVIKSRPFKIITIGLERERTELFERINKRVDAMLKNGLLEEVKELYPYRDYNALNTVGYKELFNYLNDHWTLDFAINKIKQNTRVYAKQQMRWFKKDPNIHWINLSHKKNDEAILDILRHIELS